MRNHEEWKHETWMQILAVYLENECIHQKHTFQYYIGPVTVEYWPFFLDLYSVTRPPFGVQYSL